MIPTGVFLALMATAQTLAATTAGAVSPTTSGAADPTAAGAARQDPVIEHRENFGRSVQGRPLTAYVLGDGENVTMVLGAFHGNETATPGVVESLRAHLRAHPALLAGYRVVLVPIVNPDGWQSRRRLNARGVDLNRNFPGTWKARFKRTNPGLRPASEPETEALIALVHKYQPTKVISIHQPLHMLNWTGPHSRELAATMQRANRYRSKDQIGYPTPGCFGDYCARAKIAVVTLELPKQSSAAGWHANKAALLAAIRLGNPVAQQR